jgi:hypothetical protein
MNIYKLNYLDKETAIKDFIKKGVFIEVENIDKEIVLSYGKGIQAVVEIGKIVLTNGTYDADLKELTAPVYADGYGYDIMSDNVIKFESEIFPKNSKHGFAGCEPIKEVDKVII